MDRMPRRPNPDFSIQLKETLRILFIRSKVVWLLPHLPHTAAAWRPSTPDRSRMKPQGTRQDLHEGQDAGWANADLSIQLKRILCILFILSKASAKPSPCRVSSIRPFNSG